MLTDRPKLYMVCGKVAAGKSTLCAEFAAQGAIVIAQDHWTSRLYPEELVTVADYLRLIPRLRDAIGPHIVTLLRAGLSIALDWPANTIESRAWMRGLVDAAEAGHELHYLDVPNPICLARLAQRNASGTHEYRVTREVFDQLGRYFEPPSTAEGFNLIEHRAR